MTAIQITPEFYLGAIPNGLTLLGCILSIVFIVKYQNHRALSMAQPFFLVIICIGSASIALSGIVFETTLATFLLLDNDNNDTQERLDMMCMVFTDLFFWGNIVVYMALFAKTWRLRKVIRFRRNQNVRKRHVLWTMVLMITLYSSVFFTMVAIAPPVWVFFDDSEEDGLTETVLSTGGYCDYTSDKPIFIVIIMLLTSTSGLLGYWMSRKIPDSIPEALNDGREMRRVYLIHSLIVVVFSVVYYICTFAYKVSFLMSIINLCLVFPVSIINLGLLVVPKCRRVWLDPNDRENILGRGNVVVSGANSLISGVTNTNNAPSNNINEIATTVAPDRNTPSKDDTLNGNETETAVAPDRNTASKDDTLNGNERNPEMEITFAPDTIP